MRYQVKKVGGAQAEGARRLGLIKIAESSARNLFDLGIPLTVVGNNVNDFHFFGGWHLAYPLDSQRYNEDGVSFDRFLNQYLAYLEPELGRSAAFFVDQKYVSDASPVKRRGRY